MLVVSSGRFGIDVSRSCDSRDQGPIQQGPSQRFGYALRDHASAGAIFPRHGNYSEHNHLSRHASGWPRALKSLRRLSFHINLPKSRLRRSVEDSASNRLQRLETGRSLYLEQARSATAANSPGLYRLRFLSPSRVNAINPSEIHQCSGLLRKSMVRLRKVLRAGVNSTLFLALAIPNRGALCHIRAETRLLRS